MDHLPLPKDPTFPFPRVPYLCGDRNDCTDFLTYPVEEAAQWQVFLPERGRVGPWLDNIRKRSPDGVQTVESLLQRWIFFGLLRELLHPVGYFRLEDYIDIDDEGHYVHTRGLLERVERWSGIVRTWSPERRKELGSRIWTCLGLVGSGLPSFYSSKNESDWSHNNAVQISILSICEVVHDVADMHFPMDSRSSPEIGLAAAFATTDLTFESSVVHMLNSGWCRSEIGSIESRFSSGTARHYIQRIAKPTLGLDHSRCTDDKCLQTQIVVEDYSPGHTSDGCACNFIGPDHASVVACLRDGSYPLLKVSSDTSQNDQLSLEVVPYHTGAMYVALSHVWADGLGNPHASELPRCQIVRVNALLQDLRGRSFDWAPEGESDVRKFDDELLLWVDSLCCPTVPNVGATELDRRIKQMAIGKLKAVYQNATYVLVLDKSVESIESGEMDVMEIAVRLLIGRWTSRLWTFQEATLPKKLLVKLRDQVIDIRELWRSLKERRVASIFNRNFSRDVISQVVHLRAWHYLAQTEALYLTGLMTSIRHRRVTIQSDEAICIAVVLELDVDQVTAAVDSLRMPTVWRLLSQAQFGIPPDIIFFDLPRLPNPGFRWAPASLQEPLSRRRGSSASDIDDVARGVWTPSGLIVRRAGVRFRCGVTPRGLEYLIPSSTTKELVPIKHLNGDWYNITVRSHLNLDPSRQLWDILCEDHDKDWHLILDQRSEAVGNNNCLLVYPEPGPDRRTIWRSAGLLHWARMEPNNEAVIRTAEDHASALKSHRAIRLVKFWFAALRVADRALEKIPAVLSRVIARFVIWWATPVLSFLLRRLEALMIKHAAEAAKTPEDAAALRKLYPDERWSLMVAQMRLRIGEYKAEMTEWFGYDHEWCVD